MFVERDDREVRTAGRMNRSHLDNLGRIRHRYYRTRGVSNAAASGALPGGSTVEDKFRAIVPPHGHSDRTSRHRATFGAGTITRARTVHIPAYNDSHRNVRDGSRTVSRGPLSIQFRISGRVAAMTSSTSCRSRVGEWQIPRPSTDGTTLRTGSPRRLPGSGCCPTRPDTDRRPRGRSSGAGPRRPKRPRSWRTRASTTCGMTTLRMPSWSARVCTSRDASSSTCGRLPTTATFFSTIRP